MAKFTPEQATAIAAITQVINEWGDELDTHDGLKMREAAVLTDDCEYFVGGEWKHGIDAVCAFYDERRARLNAGDGAPVMRHIISNFRVTFTGDSGAPEQADVGFLLLFFAKVGDPPFTDYCDPLAVADVRMAVRADAAGDWRISRFDSGQIFRRG